MQDSIKYKTKFIYGPSPAELMYVHVQYTVSAATVLYKETEAYNKIFNNMASNVIIGLFFFYYQTKGF